MGWAKGHWLNVVKGDTLLQRYMVPVATHDELSMKERVLLSQAIWKSLYGCWSIQAWIVGQNSHLETNDPSIFINEVTNMFIFQGRVVTKFNLYSYIKLYPSSWSHYLGDHVMISQGQKGCLEGPSPLQEIFVGIPSRYQCLVGIITLPL